jgi:hypothetical protein
VRLTFALALSLAAGSARGVMEECDVISVVTEFMVGGQLGSRCDGGARVVRSNTGGGAHALRITAL